MGRCGGIARGAGAGSAGCVAGCAGSVGAGREARGLEVARVEGRGDWPRGDAGARNSGVGAKGQRPDSQAERDQARAQGWGGTGAACAVGASISARGGGGGGSWPDCQRRSMSSSRAKRRARQAMSRAASTSLGPRRTDSACAVARRWARSSARGEG